MEPNRRDWRAPGEHKLVLVDMDGTLADVTHRLHHIRPELGERAASAGPRERSARAQRASAKPSKKKKNWPAFFRGMEKDAPNEVVAEWVRNLKPEYTVVILSGRPADYARQTVEWLRRHHIPFDHLLMRRAGDHRPDHIVKRELMHTLPRERIAFVIDDRASVCRMWRQEGLRVFQVAEGDF